MNLSLSKLIHRFLEWAIAALDTATVEAYRHQLKKFLAHVGDKKIHLLKPMHLTAWAKSWHEWQAVVRMFNWAVKEAKLLKQNPYANMKAPGREQRNRIMTPAEMVQMLRAAERPGRAYLLAVRETYARPQEIRAASWEDLQAEDPSLPIREALAKGKALIVLREFKDRAKRKESTRPRILLVSKRLGRAILRIWSRTKKAKGPIWLNSEGMPYTNNAVRCLMRRLRQKLEIEPDQHGEVVVAYTFRHSMATLASSKGIKDRVLADLLGHVETRTTARYQHLAVDHLREALEVMKKKRRAA